MKSCLHSYDGNISVYNFEEDTICHCAMPTGLISRRVSMASTILQNMYLIRSKENYFIFCKKKTACGHHCIELQLWLVNTPVNLYTFPFISRF